MASCETCRFWHVVIDIPAHDEEQEDGTMYPCPARKEGECRIRAVTWRGWPGVPAAGWCGEWLPREEMR